jgi:hypothetical protein
VNRALIVIIEFLIVILVDKFRLHTIKLEEHHKKKLIYVLLVNWIIRFL